MLNALFWGLVAASSLVVGFVAGALLVLVGSTIPETTEKAREQAGLALFSTMIEERLVQCCVHVGTRSSQDQCAPFCAVQAWPALGRQRLSLTAGKALPLFEVR